MNWSDIDNYSLEEHHFKTFLPKDATKLIIGTFPTYHANYTNTFRWFYAGEKNNFWKVFDQIFSPGFKYHAGDKAVEERKEFFRKMKIGITDMIELCYRKQRSSSDSDLCPAVLTDICKLIYEHKAITTLVLTSRTGVISALGLLKVYFLQRNLNFEQLNKRGDKIIEGLFYCDGREIRVFVPYSTSSKVTNDKITNLEELISMYKTCLFE
jgi:G:T/U-mismatch repair DNA glycosylase